MLKYTGTLVLDPAKTSRPRDEELRCLHLLTASRERHSASTVHPGKAGKSTFKLIAKPQVLLNSSAILYISVREIYSWLTWKLHFNLESGDGNGTVYYGGFWQWLLNRTWRLWCSIAWCSGMFLCMGSPVGLMLVWCCSDEQWPEIQLIWSFLGRLTLTSGQAHTGRCIWPSVQASDQEPAWMVSMYDSSPGGWRWRKKEFLNASWMTQRLP